MTDAVLSKLAEKKGVTLYPERYDSGYVLYWTVPENQWRNCLDYNKDKEGYKAGVEYEHAHDFEYISQSLPRDDSDLVSTIEELSGVELEQCSDLHIIEIPDGVDWEIVQDDEFGYEWVEEKHRSWHYNCNSENNTKEY